MPGAATTPSPSRSNARTRRALGPLAALVWADASSARQLQALLAAGRGPRVPKKTTTKPGQAGLWLRTAEAAAYAGIGRTSLWRLWATGQLPAAARRVIGRREVLYDGDLLRAHVATQQRKRRGDLR